MSESNQGQAATGDSPGAMLHAERRRQNFSVGDVSRQLKLAIRQVEALERDDYRVFGGPVFVHGFLRNYAKLLGLDAASLIAAADRKMEADGIVNAERKGEDEEADRERPVLEDSNKSVVPLFITAAVLVAGVAGWMLLQDREASTGDASTPAMVQPDMVQSDMVRSESERSEPGRSEPGRSEPGGGAGPASQAALTEPGAEIPQPPVPDSAAATALAPTAPSATGQAATPESGAAAPRVHDGPVGVLEFDFFEESWVEVTDRYGDVIYSGLNPAGVSRRVTGYPPLTVVIGNANGTVLTYNDNAVDLAPHTRVDVARITLE